MAKFEAVSRFADAGLPIPERKTADSAGYDFVVAEDTIVPPYQGLIDNLIYSLIPSNSETPEEAERAVNEILQTPKTLKEVASFIKMSGAKPTLVSTGMKCQLDLGTYLELSVRSSCPLKHWLILANGVGIIDRDYYGNSSNEGEIFFQLINLSPFAIQLKKGDCIGQGVIKPYLLTEDDEASGERLGGFGSTT